ncbi:amino acid ABC transporter permease [Planosporangium thailandense]|uniref:Amino acid ABC transporter permease n=1 Tax=Planosporangium thailandense TaxID=765197 RepID=A0ABX0Y597_9ACTN|nr:amino acid ABC transporter permease [Planosporangium thailandense]NJC73513.1 amino acid ABC transporter permease [Planosporangium thailandense]
MTALTDRTATAGEPPVDVADAVPRRHPWRWVSAAVVLVLAAQLAHLLVTNPRFQWRVVLRYFNAESVVRGMGTTLLLTVIAMAVGIVLGVLLAVGRLSRNPLIRSLSGLYVWFFRGTPALVQLIFWYNLSQLVTRLSLGIPFGPSFISADTNTLITPMLAAILGLGLNEAAYMAEIIRGGLLSVEQGQVEAAQALGMTRLRTLRRIVLPQAMRFIVPPTGSQVINMVKATSLVSVIAMADMLYTVQAIYNRTFQTIPLLIVACIWYLIITSILYVGQSFIERRYSRGATRQAPRSFLDFLKIRRTPPPVVDRTEHTA